MPPAIAEVIFVNPPCLPARLWQQLAEENNGFVLNVHIEVVAVRVRLAVQDAADLELVQVVVLPAERRLDVLVQVGQGAVGNLNPSPDRRFDVEQRDLELEREVGLLGPLAGLRRLRGEDFGVFLLEELHHPIQNGHQAFLVGVSSIYGSLSRFIVELVQFVPGDGDDLRAVPDPFELLRQGPAQAGETEQRLPLVRGEFERVGVAGLLGPLEAEHNCLRPPARQVVLQTLLEFLPGRGQGLVVVGCHG